MSRRHFFVSLLTALTLPSLSSAQVVVVPNIFTSAPGGAGSQSLIGVQNNPWTVQLIWNENQLTGLIGSQITSIRYRLNTVIPNGYPLQTTTWSDYRISMGGSVAPNQATGTYANNFVGSPVLVRSGPLTVPPFAWPTGGGGGTPHPFGVEIAFDTPFAYLGGPLAMLVTHPGSNNPDIGNALLESTSSSAPGNGTDFTRISSNNFNGLIGTTSVFSGVIQLTATPIPEPSSVALVALLLAPIAHRLRRIRMSGTLME
jgi:hypothetical protein